MNHSIFFYRQIVRCVQKGLRILKTSLFVIFRFYGSFGAKNTTDYIYERHVVVDTAVFVGVSSL